MTQITELNKNHLLARLPLDIQTRLLPHLDEVYLPSGKVLYEPECSISHAYFPINSIISLLQIMESGSSTEIAMVGNDGLVGVTLFLTQDNSHGRAVVQSAGDTFRLHRQCLSEEFERHGIFLNRVLRYTQTLITQMAQTAVCNRHHTILQHLCRWLLLSLDRLPNNKLTITQELIANLLGFRREGITEAAGTLQKLGIIEYSRGHITVLDRAKLEALCCECYQITKKESDRLLNF